MIIAYKYRGGREDSFLYPLNSCPLRTLHQKRYCLENPGMTGQTLQRQEFGDMIVVIKDVGK